VEFDDEKKRVRIVPDIQNVYKKIDQLGDNSFNFEVHPEYGCWMLETVPKKPYSTLCKFGKPIEDIR